MKLFFDKKQEQKMEFRIWNLEWVRSIFHIPYSNFHPRAFTLIELMMSVALFSTAVVIGLGALYSAQHINVKLQATRTIMDSLNLSLEVMTRNMRYGSNFYCGTGSTDISSLSRKNCPYASSGSSGGGSIVFKPVDGATGDRIAYYVDNNHLMEKVGTNLAKQISSDDMSIDNLHFYVTGSNRSPASANGDDFNGGDTDQPMVTIILSGKTKDAKVSQVVTFVLQTSVTTRNTD